MADLGRFLAVVGILLVVTGLLLTFGPRLPGISWLGRLPGDLLIRRPNVTIYIPLVSCAVVSLLLTLILYLMRR